jgi:ribonuclease Z
VAGVLRAGIGVHSSGFAAAAAPRNDGTERRSAVLFELTFLGTAASTPSPERGLPALLVAAGGSRFLIDCGEGTQRQMLRAGVGFRRLKHILLTHAHLDHVLGLGGLIATLALLQTKPELTICGSGETIGFVEGYLASLWGKGRAPVAVSLARLEPGIFLEQGDLRVACFPVRHRGTESLGFRFEAAARRHLRPERLAALVVPAGPLRAKLAAGEAVVLDDGRRVEPEEVFGPPVAGTSLVVIGDAEEVETLVEPARGADALVIEATFLEPDEALARQRGHLTAGDAGRLAAEAGVGALYLTHISGRYDPAAIAAEAARHFPSARVVSDFEKVTAPAR